MSVILDALRKLDREKASRRPGTANIASEIVRPGLPRSQRRLPFYIAIVVFTAVAAAVITYGIVEHKLKSPGTSDTASPPPSASAKSPPPAPVNPPAAAPQAQPESLNSGKPVPPAVVGAPSPPSPARQVEPAAATPPSPQPVHEAHDQIDRVPPKVERISQSRVVPSSIPFAPSMEEKKAPQSVVPEKPIAAPRNTEQPAPKKQSVAEPPATPPSLKLSAIVWHEEPSKRIAMINGTISTEGSVIEGVRVEEIRPDRVRLSYGGRVFEIPLK